MSPVNATLGSEKPPRSVRVHAKSKARKEDGRKQGVSNLTVGAAYGYVGGKLSEMAYVCDSYTVPCRTSKGRVSTDRPHLTRAAVNQHHG